MCVSMSLSSVSFFSIYSTTQRPAFSFEVFWEASKYSRWQAMLASNFFRLQSRLAGSNKIHWRGITWNQNGNCEVQADIFRSLCNDRSDSWGLAKVANLTLLIQKGVKDTASNYSLAAVVCVCVGGGINSSWTYWEDSLKSVIWI